MESQNPNHSTLESMSQTLWYNQWTLSKFASYLKGDILEVGCGFGSFTKTLAQFGNVYAIDIDPFCISKTKTIVSRRAYIGFGDIERGKYFFNNKLFTSIVCINVLEHIRNDGKALRNMYSTLSINGFLILLVPSHPKLFGAIDSSIGHFRRYTKKELIKKVTRAGFSVIKTRRINFFGSIGWLIAGKILKNTIVQKQKLYLFNIFAPLLLPFEDFIEPPLGTSLLLIAQKNKL